MKHKTKFFLLLIFIISSSNSSWATVEDSQAWTSLTVSAALTPKVDAALELHARLIEDSDSMGQRIVRPSITYKIDDHFSLTTGYFYGLFNSSTTESFYEQRLWQQVGYIFYNHDGLTLSGRTRLEERFVEDENDTGYRLRQQFRLQAPITDAASLKAVLWNETFIGLNATSWGQRNDIDQTRTFIGLSIPLNQTIAIEPGYLNQIVFRDDENRLNHVGLVAVNLKF